MRISARGGLEPHFRVLFSAVFHVFPRELHGPDRVREIEPGVRGQQRMSALIKSQFSEIDHASDESLFKEHSSTGVLREQKPLERLSHGSCLKPL